MPKLKPFYFADFESRQPDPPLPVSRRIEFLWQVSAMMAIGLGFWYLSWRWLSSLNTDLLAYSVLVASAETCAFVGMILYFHNLWQVDDPEQKPAPGVRSDVVPDYPDQNELLSVDVFIPTFDEDPELVRYSVRDACAIRYPHPIELHIHVLDDGGRLPMKRMADQEGVNYISRDNNIGYKAGNLRHAMERTSGDFIVILDADTRPFPTLLESTLGYFRDPKVAWVQTPQWFYDIPAGMTLDTVLARRFGSLGARAGRIVQRIVGPIEIGADPFVNDPKLFYDVIQRRRNANGASFCCGAGSVHRRDAVMQAALKSYSDQVCSAVDEFSGWMEAGEPKSSLDRLLTRELSHKTELTPYRFHVSEDIFTSIVLHCDEQAGWTSVLHPGVETKMLSPQDLKSWAIQRFKYAGGSLDIMTRENPLFRRGMPTRTKLYYAMTFWSYLSPLWIVVFIAAPLLALLFGISPVSSYSSSFFAHLLPFLLIHELAAILGTWGVDNRKGRMLNLAFFSINLRALYTVLRGRTIKFSVTPKARIDGEFLDLVVSQVLVVLITLFAVSYALSRAYLDPGSTDLGLLFVNVFWGLCNAYAMTVLIAAARWKPEPAAPEPPTQAAKVV